MQMGLSCLSSYTQHHACKVHAIAPPCSSDQYCIFFLWLDIILLDIALHFVIRSSGVRYLSCFHLWLTVNGGAMNIRGKVLVATLVVNAFGSMSGSGVARLFGNY